MRPWHVLALCALIGVGAPVQSSRVVVDLPGVEDPREGAGLALDVERARAARPTGITGREVTFRLRTYEPFTNADLDQQDEQDYAVAIGISTDSDRAFERLCYVHVRGDSADQDGLTPYGVVTSGERMWEPDVDEFSPRERFLGYALVRRPDPDSIEVTIPAPLLGLPASRRFHWQARTVTYAQPGTAHYDYVPDGRLARGRGGK